jgi:hypothetical protein
MVVSLAIDEPTLKLKITARMAEMVEFRMAASLNGALACKRTTISRINSMDKPIPNLPLFRYRDHHSIGLTATFDIGCSHKFFIQARN